MVLVLLRAPTSYFKPFRNYFVVIYVAFLAFPSRELVLAFVPESTALRASTELLVIAAVAIAVLWGHLTTRLYLYPEPFSFRSAFTNPTRPIHLFFLLYLIPMTLTLGATALIPGSIDPGPGRHAVYLLSGVAYRSVGYGITFLSIASSVIAAFVGYPFSVLVRLRSQLRDPEIRSALKVIASCFGLIASLLLASNALSSFGYSVIAPGHVVSIVLLTIVARAFKRPSFLKAFLGILPSLESFPSSRTSDRTVLIYESEEQKFGPVSRYVSEGVSQNSRVMYFYRDEEETVKEGLARYSVNVRHHVLKGNLRLSPLASLYQTPGMMDREAAIDTCRELTLEARTLGKESLRMIIDYGDLISRPAQTFVDHLTDSKWTSSDGFVNVLMVFSSDAFRGQESAFGLLKSRVPVLELSETVDAFSRSVGLSHAEMMGKKILFEFDPLSDYDKVLKSLLAESASNFERAVVFTRRDSPVLSIVGEKPRHKTFIMTSRVSYPRLEGENLVLLPAYDTSLLLDSLQKTIDAYAGGSFTIIFDSISHYIFTLGSERAQSLVRQALELMISDKITSVFLMNLGAHDQKTISTFETFFDVELVRRRDARALEVRKRLAVAS